MIRIFLITLGVWTIGVSYAQNPNRIAESKESRCSTKSFCEDFYGDFDYRGQSSFGEFAPGDTLRSKIIVYSGQDYRIFACGQKDLGDIQFKVIEPIKEYKTVVKDIKKEDVIEYELDEWGGFKVDEQTGEMIVKSKTVKYDTIYEKQTLLKESLIFDSMNNKNNSSFWGTTVKKTKRLVVEVVIPAGEEDFRDCVNIYVGRMQSASKSFSRY